MAGVATSSRQRSKIAPYLMILPALAYLGIFFVVPFFSLARTSLSATGGSVFMPTLTFAWDFGNYADAFSLYRDQIFRSFGYALSPRCCACCWPSRWPMSSRSRPAGSRT